MKLNALFIIAGLILTTACGEKKPAENQKNNVTETPTFSDGLKIGYYHNDSLNENYKLIEAITNEMESKIGQMSSSFEQKVKSFENWARSYDEKMRNNMLISSEIEKFQQQYQQRQMELEREQQNLQMQVQQIQNDNLMKAFKRVEDFCKRYAEENGYDLILQYAQGGQVMYISPAMDVTADIVNGLNAEYDELNEPSESK